MDFYDEILIKARREAKKERYNSLETGMYAGEELITFQKRQLFDNRCSIYLPESFTEMQSEWKKIKYPYENRPQIIFMDESGSVNLAFSLLKPDIEPIDLSETRDSFMIVLKKMNSSNVFLDKGDVEAMNVSCAWCEMRGQNLDGSIYNLIFLCEINHKLLLGNFSCLNEERTNWKGIVFKLIQSICEEELYEGK